MLGSINDVMWFADMIKGYAAANIDANANTKTYYGFVNKHGEWYIIERSDVGTIATFKYFKGPSAYSTGWTGRTSLAYNTFDVIFR